MVILSNSDYFDVRLATLLADYDKDTLANLYQPIIGYQAFALYLSLWTEANNQKVTSMSTHEEILNRMQIPAGEFIKARKTLEAVGLLKTYLNKQIGSTIYNYVIYAPKTPKEFFDDTLLHGTLLKYSGEEVTKKLKQLYQYKEVEQIGEDVSSSFQEVYNPDLNDPVYVKALENGKSIGRRRSHINTEFSYEKFFDELKKISQISPDVFTKKDMSEISRISTLYGIKEDISAQAVADIYNIHAEKGKHIDFPNLIRVFQEENIYSYHANKKEGLRTAINSETALASKINLMEVKCPKDYLSILQGGTKVALSDLKVVEMLSSNFNLPNPVINAVIDFVLTVNHNVLSRAYAEKIGASLAREGIVTTIDAMNFLRKANKPFNKKEPTKVTTTHPVVEHNNPVKTESLDDKSWDDLINELEEGENDHDKA